VRARARYLYDTFYPEVRAVFALASRLGTDPLAIRGSGSGAFGAPQFLPTSYFRHGVDGDGDGRVDLDDPADAAISCASYLRGAGWRPGLSAAGRRRVIWGYNHSDAYIDTVLALASAIDHPAPVRVAHAVRRGTTTTKTAAPARKRATKRVIRAAAG
jgi:membrane-bound lytic murein transglycosylase B